ncbi:MAG: hypothetical protein U0835_09650 [Isosphaeraceae bacterium]
MTFCTYEDRPRALPGVKLLLLSAGRAMPDETFDVTCPNLADALTPWLDAVGLKNVRVRREREWAGEGWSSKPGKLLELLDEGHDQVFWIDTDVIVTSDVRPLVRSVPTEAVVVGQEFRTSRPGWVRGHVAGWGLEFARELPHAVNSGTMRYTQAHRPLLRRWKELLAAPEFQSVQKMPIAQRPAAMVGDQDALTALLGSSEFGDVPVHFLKCGREVIQNSGANGYHVLERLANLGRGLPPLIHMLGREKPWDFSAVPSARAKPRDYLELVAIELSPYVAFGRRFQAELGEPAPWLSVRTAAGKVCSWGGLGHPTLQGLPLALVAQCLAKLRKPQV